MEDAADFEKGKVVPAEAVEHSGVHAGLHETLLHTRAVSRNDK